jgi:CHU domain-containing protein
MMIYSLSGQFLYSTTDFSKPWNGRRNNDGELMPVGTYLWKVNLYDDNNEIHPHNGQIKIVNFK